MNMFGDGSRLLQDRYKARNAADAIVEATMVTHFDDSRFPGYRDYVEAAPFFFLATSSGTNTDCSFKGGARGFVRFVGPDRLIFPDYDGNRMYKSLGNMLDNPQIGMLFMRFDGEEDNRFLRVRINGTASLHDSHPAIADYPGAKRIVEVHTHHIYLNCPRYIPRMAWQADSPHLPQHGKDQPVPAWKNKPGIKEALAGSL
jgi:predicted pyridoxine 5'-phosphate oxidase superfamily flavin-nucleotide-binding protein